MTFDYERLRDFKNHYRGLAQWQNSKLVCIRKLVEEIDKGRNYVPYFFDMEQWSRLLELVKPELYRLPSEESMKIDLLIEEL